MTHVKCRPYCEFGQSKVTDGRTAVSRRRMRRRRTCLKCRARMTTYEVRADELAELDAALKLVEDLRAHLTRSPWAN